MHCKFYFLLGLSLFILVPAGKALAATSCEAEVEIAVKNFDGDMLPDIKFQVYQQEADINGNPKPGDEVGSGKTEKYLGRGTAKVKVTEEQTKYVVRVYNPSLKNADFWFFDELTLACGDAVSGSIVLSGFSIRVQEPTNLSLIKDSKINFYEQKSDAAGVAIPGTNIGSFNTGDSGRVIVYVPSRNRSLVEYPVSLMMEVKDAKGNSYYKQGLIAEDKMGVYIDYKLSELAVTVKDAGTGNMLPGITLELREQTLGQYKDLVAGKLLATLKTDDQGQAFVKYPPGTYLLQFKYPSGQYKVFNNIVITEETRVDEDLVLEDYDKSKCSLKSNLKVSFRDPDGKIVTNLGYNVYEQTVNQDGNPIASSKVASGNVDQFGYGKSTFYPSPAKKYAVEVCDKSVKYACFWFFNVTFACSEDLSLEKMLPTTGIILRTADKKLAVNQRVKVYLQTIDVDGNKSFNKDKNVIDFKLPQSGKQLLRLSPIDWQGEEMVYYVVVDLGKNKTAMAEFKPNPEGYAELEYVIKDNKLVLYRKDVDAETGTETISTGEVSSETPKNLLGTIKGKILLQVESKGEAWYVNPANNKRYYLGRPEDAFSAMRRLSIGATTDSLNKIAVAVSGVNDQDNDQDGLVNSLEKALGTDWNQADTDGDGFSDYEEVAGNFNPNGAGKMPVDGKFSVAQAGRILLQVDGSGEAWYIFPNNLKRYYLGRPADAFFVMRELGLGITNANLEKIAIGD